MTKDPMQTKLENALADFIKTPAFASVNAAVAFMGIPQEWSPTYLIQGLAQGNDTIWNQDGADVQATRVVQQLQALQGALKDPAIKVSSEVNKNEVNKNLDALIRAAQKIEKEYQTLPLPGPPPRVEIKSAGSSRSQQENSASFQAAQPTKFVEAHAKKCFGIHESIGYLKEAIRGKDMAIVKEELGYLAKALSSTESKYKGGLTAEDKNDFMAVMDKVNGLIDSGKLKVGAKTEDALDAIAARATKFEIVAPAQESPRDDMSNRSTPSMSMKNR